MIVPLFSWPKIEYPVLSHIEDNPSPELCLTAYEFNYDSFNTSMNVSYDDWKDGNWLMPGYTEEELFDILAPDLDQLVNKIKIARVLQLDSDQYDKISASPEGKNIITKGRVQKKKNMEFSTLGSDPPIHPPNVEKKIKFLPSKWASQTIRNKKNFRPL